MPATYDRFAAHYERAIAPLERRFLRRLRKEAVDALPADSRLLEFGAGTGLNFCFYQPHTQVVATEPSTEMLRIAATKECVGTLALVQCSAEHLPFADKSFDGVLATLVMCSVKSPDSVFAELQRVVKTGGKISLLEHVRPNGVLGLIFDLLNMITVRLFDDHFNRRTADTARRAGLEVISVKRAGWGIINLITCVV